MKTRRTFSKLMLGLSAVLLAGGVAQAADYPTKQIELIVPYAAGGGTDLVARAYADAAKKYLPQAIGVVNKTGGAGAVRLTEIMASRPDGYKIGMGTVEIAMLPHMGVARFTVDDYIPIARLNAEPTAITVNAEAPWKTIDEFLAYAKANPGKVRIGNSGTGAIWHIAAEAIEEKTGLTFNHIPYDGANPAVTALLGKHIEAVSVSPAEVIAHVAAGKLRILAVGADERAKAFPDVPTLKEKGVDVSIYTWRGIVVPKKTPQAVVNVLREASKKTAEDPAFRETLSKMNLTWAYADSAVFKAAMDKDNLFFKDMMTKIGLAR
ncbi:MAG: ABC transporter substrate-binding protein [Candidatus Dactylopiibacterium carminicum]|uniref:ABC transporter substrate-binding protein n=1 Tax=Candidatus Dactylopiibacterium carminicum TaxID=857335 RepID=A0A272EMS4_9RHOO|nr:tripartite tricarboxylate transporter substrate binding protein [Candidatus Dactylopiibacterium carminicum]KAF7597819.1 tripartite tricarboxylate transporter substrate binding protein [Candidatus Dactylopiibacterium carminicum]PAS91415.1 MAG: ABC transporter substrate-binding protein [Candidatus Dactylopiibacterium carminicum]PAS95644.1 MAG: ABC transporter substrate-binding protein [Candidatus Dactylopiibacterium carminicum]